MHLQNRKCVHVGYHDESKPYLITIEALFRTMHSGQLIPAQSRTDMWHVLLCLLESHLSHMYADTRLIRRDQVLSHKATLSTCLSFRHIIVHILLEYPFIWAPQNPVLSVSTSRILRAYSDSNTTTRSFYTYTHDTPSSVSEDIVQENITSSDPQPV